MKDCHDYFDITTTDAPIYDNMLKGRRDFETWYIDGEWQEVKITCEIEYMSPDEYLERCCVIQNTTMERTLMAIDKKNLENLIHLIENDEGFRFPLPFFNMVRMGQEGRHRAVIAKRLGLDRMPVMVIREKTY